MAPYEAFIGDLRSAVQMAASTDGLDRDRSAALLDGEASRQLRRLVPAAIRKESGAFFSGSVLAAVLAAPLEEELTDTSVILDPMCGAGDLLLPFVPSLLRAGADLNWSVTGRDIHPQFVEAARLRLRLAQAADSNAFGPASFARVRAGSPRLGRRSVARASHIVMNPPFVGVEAPADLKWASGLTNSAAIHLLSVVNAARPGAVVRAVLPDVLRSGSRYRRWRSMVDESSETLALDPYGKFDADTDVDVFLLTVRIGEAREVRPWHSPPASECVGDHFSVSVGRVVNYRDPHTGPQVPYLLAKQWPKNEVISTIHSRRQFSGPLVSAPFVAVARTSGPRDVPRARAVVVTDASPIAVDNHVLVAKPKSGGLTACQHLQEHLSSRDVDAWLNERIRCRHLTVASLREIPWKGPHSHGEKSTHAV